MSTNHRLLDLLQRWEEEHARGHDLTPEVLCSDDPDLLDEVRRRISQLLGFGRLVPPEGELSETVCPEKGASAHPALPPPHAPARFGGYVVLARLGAGSFGAVYKARDPEADRLVALKVPHPRLVASPKDADAYLHEARSLARLDHPNIVPLYHVGHTPDGLPFLVSKFVEGADLSARLARGRPPLDETVGIVDQAARALHHAHKHGIVHRDVKPANLLLDLTGRVLVADFGLALREEDVGKGGAVVGTPAYMSPEQVRGEGHRVDARSDVFSLGAVFYELLTGRCPFPAENLPELFEQIRSHEPRPPRQFDDTIPREIDRICLKCLQKRAADRYSTALDLAEDLDHWRRGRGAPSPATPLLVPAASAVPSGPALSSDRRLAAVVPKGLRAFDAADADFFRALVPGPRDRDGLPESVRFWKQHIDALDPDVAFRVGLLYGPSGGGKSSLVRAALLPALAEHVVALCVEASAGDTEARLRAALRRRFPALPENVPLAEALGQLRRGFGLPAGQKLLFVVDQLEQWLHGRSDFAGAELVQALRQCDGERVQALLLVRDDFWMATTRLLRDVEVPLREGQNSAAADLFDLVHARKVLAAFGRAYNRLPEAAPSADEERFLHDAVAGLAEGGKVVPVRLALFAEMVKGKPWLPATLKALGGAEGVGVTFLDETFRAATAPPECRRHKDAARAVLTALLPQEGVEIKGHLRSYSDLLAVSGYAHQPAEFERLMALLDAELRLVTPAEGDAAEARRYQLTHDYLVPSLRTWLTRQQGESLRGRATRRLAERAAAWAGRREKRQLPSVWEWASIAAFTRRRDRTEPQRALMRAATAHHLTRGVVLAVALAGLLAVGLVAYRGQRQRADLALANSYVVGLLPAEPEQVPQRLALLEPLLPLVEETLREARTGEPRDDRARLNAALALLPADPDQESYLRERLLAGTPEEVALIRDTLRDKGHSGLAPLWQPLTDPSAGPGPRLRAACALAPSHPGDPRWQDVLPRVADALVAQDQLHAGKWTNALRQVGHRLVPPLAAVFRDARRPLAERLLAASVLADFARDRPDDLAGLVAAADEAQLRLLLPALAAVRDTATGATLAENLRREIGPNPVAATVRPFPPLAAADRAALEGEGVGLIGDTFGLCQTLPLARFHHLKEALRVAGYRPICFRPWTSADGVRVATVLARDGRPWHVEVDLTAADALRHDQELRPRGFIPFDVAGYVVHGEERYAVLWGEKDTTIADATLLVGEVPLDERWRSLEGDGFVPRTQVPSADPSSHRYSAVWWKEALTARFYPRRREDALWYDYRLGRGLTQTDVRIARATPLTSRAWTEYQRDLAEQKLRDRPDDRTPLLTLGIVRHYLGDDAGALDALTNYRVRGRLKDHAAAAVTLLAQHRPFAAAAWAGYFSTRPGVDNWLDPTYQALCLARLGKKDKAGAELGLIAAATDALRQVDAAADGLVECHMAVVLLHLGRTAEAVAKLDEAARTFAAGGDAAFLYELASAYAVAARFVPERFAAFAEQAADRLKQCLNLQALDGDHLLYDLRRVHADPNFDAVRDHPAFRGRLTYTDKRLTDVRRLEERYSGVWQAATDTLSEAVLADAPTDLLARCRALADQGGEPASLSVADMGNGRVRCAAVWHRRVVADDTLDAAARRRANAAVALVHLGHADAVVPLLGAGDPRPRALLLHRLARMSVKPEEVARQLARTADPAVAAALLLTLGDIPEGELPAADRRPLADRLGLPQRYRDDPDPGVHAALDWLLRRWGLGDAVRAVDNDPALATGAPVGGRRWYVTRQGGQTLAVVGGPRTFAMGSPDHEADRNPIERSHPRRTRAAFALGTKEVTRRQYLFEGEGGGDRDLPAVRASWFDAARFCNELSRRENIPKAEWCYEGIQGGKYFQLADGYLARTGYRLPTEVEWEYACRGGTATSRPYGSAEELLGEYAWYERNSGRQPHPVGLRKPNAFGLFDVLGNAAELCLLRRHRYLYQLEARGDVGDEPSVRTTDLRAVRGGHFLDGAANVRSAARGQQKPGEASAEVGFRVARTMPR